MLQVTVTITGSKETRKRLDRLGASLLNFKDAMDEIGKTSADYFSNQGFASQGGVFGAKWQPLQARYAVRKFRRFPGRSPLVASGAMQRGFTYTAGRQEVTVSNKTEYFKYHQSTAPRSHLPRRQMMGINQPIKNFVGTIIKDDITRKIRAA